jgi:hypothetical protein
MTPPPPASDPTMAPEAVRLGGVQLEETECRILPLLKKEFEFLYKHLMKLMMTCKTSKLAGDRVAYLLDTDEFSMFERRLNNVVE